MNKNKIALLSLFILHFSLGLVFAQQKKIIFNKLNTSNGLSSNLVFDIIECPQGFKWIATRGGLDRFDGKTVKHYNHYPADSTSISSDIIRAFCLDNKGRLWVASDAGLSRYLPENDCFKNFRYHPPKNPIPNVQTSLLLEDKKGNIWIYQDVENRLFLFNPDTEKVLFQIGNVPHSSIDIPSDRFSRLFVDSKNWLWFVCNKKVFCLSYTNKKCKIEHTFAGNYRDDINYQANPRIAIEATNGDIYVCNHGLFLFRETKSNSNSFVYCDIFEYKTLKAIEILL